jgi:hypothetical protein
VHNLADQTTPFGQEGDQAAVDVVYSLADLVEVHGAIMPRLEVEPPRRGRLTPSMQAFRCLL